jgi:hypothetical protein
VTRNSLGILSDDRDWISSSHPPPRRLAVEGILVVESDALKAWIRESPNPDLTKDFLESTPHRLASPPSDTDFLVGNILAPGDPRTLQEIVNGDEWLEKRVSENPIGRAVPPREGESPVVVWNRMLGQATKYSSRVEIVDRYLFNNFRNFRAGESPLERILAECLSSYTGEIRFHCGRLEDVKYSYENTVRRIRATFTNQVSKKPPRITFRLCKGKFKGRDFAHDRWVYFSFSGGPGVMYSLGKGIEDIHGTLDVRLLSEHLAPNDWTRLDAQTKYLEDTSASNRLNQLVSQTY